MRQALGMKRALALVGVLAAVLAVSISAAGAAAPRIQIAQVDTSRYPLVTATVIAPNSDKLKNVDLQLGEKGVPQVTTQTGGSSQAAIGLAIDVSRSMKGAPLDAARQAAASFIRAKRPNDLIGVYSFGHTANPIQSPVAASRRARRRRCSRSASTRFRARRSTTRSSRPAASSPPSRR